MLKVGDILWTFRENNYFVGEISNISIFDISKELYYLVNTNGIIGTNQIMIITATEDFNTLVKMQYYSETIYNTISESVAVNYIKTHFNETDNQRNLQQDASKQL